MTRTITALFDQRRDAEAAEARLKAANIDAGHIGIHDKTSAGYSDTAASTHAEPGIWASIRNAFLPDDDRHTYEEGVRRGGFLLTADVGEEHVEDAVRVLEEADTVDLDDRAQQWKSSGWAGTPPVSLSEGYGDDTVPTGALGATSLGETSTGTASAGALGEEVIPIVEESLVVGKREVDRGGVRVRSYVTEVPVHEQIRLRDERIDVQRRAVDLPLSAADGDAFREQTIDVTATGEEAVIGKTARVVEEVVVSKTSDEHVEQIDDTVRRTDVEIDRDIARPDAKG
ncbi:YsnF/AvaK domain-containing protein [Sphingomonas bacterium]|uniref:YsnF/AvaK domain-containing protein n=1 Tax=Sphingomonas bacterium TaxID=1895847 RepID=UPI00157534D3|nr:YsnF/AvaK domain-containing protein [Sphingomonas bacterium]